jgi:RsiW-degrading membrane proteinase PrsW (M82 family)
MCWRRDTRVLSVVLLLLALIGYFVVYGVAFPLLWPYREHPLVWLVLAFLSGGHLEELFQQTGTLL